MRHAPQVEWQGIPPVGPPEGKGFPSKLCADAWDLKTFGDWGSGHVAVHRGGGIEE